MQSFTEKIKDPAFWATVREHDAYRPFRDELLCMWDKYCLTPIPAVKYSELVIFSETGSRAEYEGPYFMRRCALNTAALLCAVYPDNDSYMTALCDALWAILDEYTWALPAHIGQPSSPDFPTMPIDLFAAETGYTLSEIDYMLGDRLPPLIRRRIEHEVNGRIIEAFLSSRFKWETRRNNWAAVCIAGVAGAFIYMCPDKYPLIADRVRSACEYFLSSFPPDGFCLEGFGYWHYGFGYFTCLRDLLLCGRVDGGPDLYADGKIAAIASYPERVMLGGGVVASFADSGRTGLLHIGMIHYLKRAFPELGLTLPPRFLTYTCDRCARFALHLRAIVWFDPEYDAAFAASADGGAAVREAYAPDSQILVKVTRNYAFAAKGGHNGEPHNHCDLGSFIVSDGCRQLLCDPGSGVYTRDYFSDRRYLDFSASSRGHSVPSPAAQHEQLPGKEYAAACEYAPGMLALDLSGAYALPVGSIIRRFEFGERSVVLTDCVGRVCGDTVEHFVAAAEPSVEENGNVRIGALLLSASVTVETGDSTNHADDYNASVLSPRVYPSPRDGVWCIDYSLPEGNVLFRLGMTI